ncbi:lysylphosphatidylglycerol synthase domain-containing protein [Desulfofustis glycolicus]|uniref:Lysylphosphatidylglycerol synthase TM region n=1 Tax=Desulfofustis glycolicus DSM 9705 TaxID=1121409 RepID=A0A1M5YV64_9BACT|nr:lysylphosphatidylglycerol synthase domain-containing protein [Desulfofustis glycolicus]SHI15901.1 Lysylphosphatidylglycerol synthase TM region [Desulfofustis glycolicus DSM 9705]
MLFSKYNKLFQGIILSLCIIILSTYAYYHRNQAAQLATELGLVEAIIVFLTIGGQIGIRTICEKLHYNSIGYNIPVFALYKLLAQQNVLNYLPFKAGTIYTASLLRLKYNIPIFHYAAVFTAQNLLALGTTLMAAGIALLFTQSISSQYFLASTVLIFAGIFTLAMLFIRIPNVHFFSTKINKNIRILSDAIAKCKQHPITFLSVTILRFLAIALMTWRFQILFNMSDTEISFSIALVLSASMLISLFIAITPAGLGIRELLLAVTSSLMLIPPSTAVIISILERVLVLVFSAVIAVAGFFWTQSPTKSRHP